MPKFALLIGLIVIIVGGYFAYTSFVPQSKSITEITEMFNRQGSSPVEYSEKLEVLASNLEIPWDLAFLPSGDILLTERKESSISLLLKDESYRKMEIWRIASLAQRGEGGMLGITIHPNFKDNNFIYIYYTRMLFENKNGELVHTGKFINRIDRLTLVDNSLNQSKMIIDYIPGSSNHDGGRIKFGPDGKLYATTGDAEVENLSQDTASLAGKILRLNDDGSIPDDNPISGSPVYSYGHRNPQGLAWDKDGRLWATEHGSQAFDEVNLIYSGKNYGWPTVRGDDSEEGLEVPYLHSGRGTWAPSGATIFEDNLYYTGLRGGAVYKLNIGSQTSTIAPSERKVQEFFKNQFGRIRTITLGPDKNFYILTNNKDGRGNPAKDDDRLIRISPDLLK